MRIAIFGANGATGRLLTRRVLDGGHSAVAVTRAPDEFPIHHPQLTVTEADVRQPSAVDEVMAGADAALSTLGVPFTRHPVDTYTVGTANIVAAMQRSGVRRLVVVSSTGAYPTPGRTDAPLALRLVEPVITRTIGKAVYDDIRRMDNIVEGSDLDWTIVRPSGLFDLERPTNYLAGQQDPVGPFTARIDLADYLARLIDEPGDKSVTTISTVQNTPTIIGMIMREAFK